MYEKNDQIPCILTREFYFCYPFSEILILKEITKYFPKFFQMIYLKKNGGWKLSLVSFDSSWSKNSHYKFLWKSWLPFLKLPNITIFGVFFKPVKLALLRNWFPHCISRPRKFQIFNMGTVNKCRVEDQKWWTLA